MSQFSNIFGAINRAKSMASYSDKLPKGKSQFVVMKYEPKQSQKNGSTFLAAEFVLLQTTAEGINEGDRRGWAWFIEGKDFAGQYAMDDANKFLTAVMRSIDVNELPRNAQGQIIHPTTGAIFPQTDPNNGQVMIVNGAVVPKTEHDTATIGELLNDGILRGVQLSAEVNVAFDKKTGGPRLDQTGREIVNATWKPVGGQTLASIAAVRDQLEPPVATPVAAPPPASSQAATKPAGSSILAGLRK